MEPGSGIRVEFPEKREAKLQQRDLWKKAQQCAEAIDVTSDPTQRAILSHLKQLWINLANESAFLKGDELAEQIATVDLIHAGLTQLRLH